MSARSATSYRIEIVEEEVKSLKDGQEEINTKIEDLKKWLSNGFSDRLSGMIAKEFLTLQQKIWEDEREERRLQLEEQRIKNKAMGEERERKMKIWLGVLGAGGPIITAIGAAILWLATGGAK